MQPPSREKDLFDTAMDFFWGAVGGLLLMLFLSKPGRRGSYIWHLHFTTLGWWFYFIGGMLTCGALTSLYRDRMSEPTLLSNIPSDPSKSAQVVLWMITLAGGGLVAAAFHWMGQN
jgi:hypothetical protein